MNTSNVARPGLGFVFFFICVWLVLTQPGTRRPIQIPTHPPTILKKRQRCTICQDFLQDEEIYHETCMNTFMEKFVVKKSICVNCGIPCHGQFCSDACNVVAHEMWMLEHERWEAENAKSHGDRPCDCSTGDDGHWNVSEKSQSESSSSDYKDPVCSACGRDHFWLECSQDPQVDTCPKCKNRYPWEDGVQVEVATKGPESNIEYWCPECAASKRCFWCSSVTSNVDEKLQIPTCSEECRRWMEAQASADYNELVKIQEMEYLDSTNKISTCSGCGVTGRVCDCEIPF